MVSSVTSQKTPFFIVTAVKISNLTKRHGVFFCSSNDITEHRHNLFSYQILFGRVLMKISVFLDVTVSGPLKCQSTFQRICPFRLKPRMQAVLAS
jgi:hypothetical protein